MEPEEKEKFAVLKLDDTKAQILYQELKFGNYMLFTEGDMNEQINENQVTKVSNENKDVSGVWTLEFDGSCTSVGSGAGVVLISPEGELEPMAFKLEFGNTNNTAEYEALLLRIMLSKERGVKILKSWGDVELIVK